MSENVFITGGTGFLGKRLAITLANRGYNVTAVGRNAAIGNTLQEQGIRFVRADITNTSELIPYLHGQDIVFHCAALSTLWGKYSDFYATNVIGTQHVIRACFKHQVKRLIYVSSPSIYANHSNQSNIYEDTVLPIRSINHYAKTKRIAEDAIDQAYDAGLPVITIRPRAIFGPEDPSIFPRLLHANQSRKLPLIDGGAAQIDLTYIDNVVHALILCMSAPTETLGQKYNISNGQPQSLISLVQLLFNKLKLPINGIKLPYSVAYGLATLMEGANHLTFQKKEPLLTRSAVAMIGRTQTLNITKAQRKLNYQPIISVEEGIELYAKWLAAHKRSF